MNTAAIHAIKAAFEKAKASGIRKPKIRLFYDTHSFEISRAPDNGLNPGSLYVKEQGAYLGKIVYGVFWPSYECTVESEDAVLNACANPLEAAVAYGQKFGICSCCGRTLSNQESIDLGIGPVCRERFF
jgi:Family of unknown function (DUF6011)